MAGTCKGFLIGNRGQLTLRGKLLFWVLRHRGILSFILKYGRIGKFTTPIWYDKQGNKHGGVEYFGIRFSWRW